MNEHDALRTATILGAEAIGLDGDIGSIQVGKLADFVVVPDLLQLQVTNPRPQTNTQDLVFSTMHFGAGFQF